MALRDIGDLLGSGRRADRGDAGGSEPAHCLFLLVTVYVKELNHLGSRRHLTDCDATLY